MLSILVPTLNAEKYLADSLAPLSAIADEIIISDGGSRDATLRIAVGCGAILAVGQAGRGRQLARAARFSRGDWLLFLHADTVLTGDWYEQIKTHMRTAPGQAAYFRFCLNARGFRARVMEYFVRLRSQVFALPYGDQGLLISRTLYEQIGGYDERLDLFEDVAIIRKLGRKRLKGLSAKACTSAARYEQGGYFRRGLKNLILLRRYFKGASQQDLKKAYYS